MKRNSQYGVSNHAQISKWLKKLIEYLCTEQVQEVLKNMTSRKIHSYRTEQYLGLPKGVDEDNATIMGSQSQCCHPHCPGQWGPALSDQNITYKHQSGKLCMWKSVPSEKIRGYKILSSRFRVEWKKWVMINVQEEM